MSERFARERDVVLLCIALFVIFIIQFLHTELYISQIRDLQRRIAVLEQRCQ